MKKIIVEIGTSEDLGKAVLAALPVEISKRINPNYYPQGISFCLDETLSGPGFARSDWYRWEPAFKNHTFINAATEFGRLLELLEEKDELRIKCVTDSYLDGIIAPDKSKITVAASVVTRDKVKEIYEAFQNPSPKLIIHTGDNETLNGIVYDLIVGSDGRMSDGLLRSVIVGSALSIRCNGGEVSYASGAGTYRSGYNDYLEIDARTEFGKLVDLFARKFTIEKVTGTLDGRITETGIQVGCAFISKEKVTEVWEAMK